MTSQKDPAIHAIVDWYGHNLPELLASRKADDEKKKPVWSFEFEWAALFELYDDQLGDAGSASGFQAFVQARGVGDEDLAQMQRVVDFYAQRRAAEMVGKTYDPLTGELVDNPNAAMRIDESTRSMIQKDIEQALDEGMDADELSQLLQENYAFSQVRADIIAENELAMAHTAATLSGWAASGNVESKISVLSEEHDEEDECDDNADVGPIPLAAAFPTGDYGPPYHNRCKCRLTAVFVTTEPSSTLDPSGTDL